MRHGSSTRRKRSRGNGGRRNSQAKTQVYDSNGPDVRIRGTAYQVTEKYLALAKDAKSVGDESLAENYLQHAEHYQRIINSFAKDSDAQKGREAQDKPQEAGSNADLSLPASILGDSPNAGSEAEAVTRTDELTTA